MKILIISKSFLAVSSHKVLEELAAAKGVDLILLSPRKFKGKRAEQVRPRGYKIIYQNLIFPGSFHLSFYRRAKILVKQIKPDLILIDDEPYNLVTFQFASIGQKFRIKTIFVCLQTIFKKYPFLFNFFEKSVFKKAAGAVALTQSARQLLLKRGFQNPIAVIPYSVDPELFRPAESPALKVKLGLKNEFVIGYFGRLVLEKGLEILAGAVAQLPGEIPWRVLMVGSGNYKNKLLRKIRALKIRDKFIFIDSVGSWQVAEYLNCLDVLVLPSYETRRWHEQFGRILIEAMSSEVAVIGADSGQIPQVLARAGLTFKQNDSGDLKEKLLLLMKNPQTKNALAQAGRQLTLENFHPQRCAGKFYNFFQEILG